MERRRFRVRHGTLAFVRRVLVLVITMTVALGIAVAGSVRGAQGATPSVDAPTEVVITATFNGSLTATWRAANVRAGAPAVQRYIAYTSPGGLTCITAATSCTIAGVTSGTRYTVTVVADNGVETSYPSLPSPPVLVGLSRYTPVPPTRVLDTRPANRLSAASTTIVPIAARVGRSPAEVTAAVVNLTVTEPAGAGYVSASASPTAAPDVSNVNASRSGQTIANLATVPVGPDGAIALYNSVATHLVVDLVGVYVATSLNRSGDGRYFALAPSRLLDTRSARGVSTTRRLNAGETVTFDVTGRVDVPGVNMQAAMLTVTVTDSLGAGFVSAYPAGVARPAVSSVNVDRAGQTVANASIVAFTDGRVSVYASMSTHVVVDIVGYFSSSSGGDLRAATGYYVPIPPVRVHDTRSFVKPTARTTIAVPVLGAPNIPVTGVSSVAVNITGTEPNGDGYVTAFPGGTLPTVSTMNLTRTVPIMASHTIVGIGTGGAFRIYSQSGTHLVVDVFGWFT